VSTQCHSVHIYKIHETHDMRVVSWNEILPNLSIHTVFVEKLEKKEKVT
jgi:hypothetical protein